MLSSPKLVQEFKSFLLKNGVIGLAIGVVMGGAVNKLVKAIVDDIAMPLVGALTPSGDWRALILPIGPVKIGIGDLLGNLLDFAVVSALVFFIVRAIVKEEAKS